MKRTAKELIEKLSTLTDTTNGDALTLVEDITDSVGNQNQEDWKKMYEENDAEWRKRYRDRFLKKPIEEEEEEEKEKEKDEGRKKEPLTFDSLFKKGE